MSRGPAGVALGQRFFSLLSRWHGRATRVEALRHELGGEFTRRAFVGCHCHHRPTLPTPDIRIRTALQQAIGGDELRVMHGDVERCPSRGAAWDRSTPIDRVGIGAEIDQRLGRSALHVVPG